VTGPDPGRIDDDTTAYLADSLVDEDELAKLVTSGMLVEGQAFAPGKAVVPKPGDNRTMVFAVFFEAGLRFPCNVLLPEILRLFQVELPQLSPSALVRIAIFDRACRTAGFERSAELFGVVFYATVNSKMVVTPAGTKKTVFVSVNFNVRPGRSDLWPVNAAMSKWDRHWMSKWFYHAIPFEVGSDAVKALRWRRRPIVPNQKPKAPSMALWKPGLPCSTRSDPALAAATWWRNSTCFEFSLSPSRGKSRWTKTRRSMACRSSSCLQGRTMSLCFSYMYLCFALFPYSTPDVVKTFIFAVLTLAQADTEARKMIGDVSIAEFNQLLTRQAADRANRVHDGKLPPRAKPFKADGDEADARASEVGPSEAKGPCLHRL
jgi:hypothetical protein